MFRSLSRLPAVVNRIILTAAYAALAALLPIQKALAQQPVGDRPYRVEVWRSDRGVRGDLVLGTLIRTPDGYLWMRTLFGLTRFDGVRFTTFNADNTPAFEGTGTSQRPLLLDRRGRLWIATSLGLISYESRRFARGPRYSGGMLSMAEDAAGRLWSTSTTGKLFRSTAVSAAGADGGTLEEVSLPELPAGSAVGVAADASGRIWVGFESPARVVRITPTAGSFEVRTFASEDGLAGGELWAMNQGRAGVVWVGASEGVTRIEGDTLTRVPLPPHTEWLSSITEGRDGEAWFGSNGSGLFRYSPRAAGLQRVGQAEGLSHDRITALLADAQGSLWAASVQGLNRLSRPIFSTLPPLTSATAAPGCFVRAADNTLWLASESGDLFRGSASTFSASPHRVLLPDVGRIQSMSAGRDGAVWIARRLIEVWRVVGDSAERLTFRTPIGDVRLVFEDSRGTLWLGTNAGVLRVRDGVERMITERDGLHGVNVHHFVEGRDGAVWAAGTEGVTRIAGDDVRAWRGDARGNAPVALRAATETFRDSRGTIWLATQTGLTRVLDTPAGPSFATLRVQRGLPENWVTEIVEDADQQLWLVGLEGIARVALDELNAVADGRKKVLERVSIFAMRDGLPSAGIAAGGNCSRALRTDDGRLWFSLARGVAYVDPRLTLTESAAPQTHIEELLIDGATVPVSDRLTVPAGAQRLELRYTGVDLQAGDAVRFQYRLDGFDPDWIDAGDSRTISYTNLAPGQYRFSVRARSAAGLSSEQPATLAVTFVPPFYKTGWFIAAVTLAVLGGVWLAYRARARVVRARFDAVLAERSRVAREMHDTLLSGVAGVALRLDVASGRDPRQMPPALASELADLRDVVHQMLQDARRAVGDLRLSTSGDDLNALVHKEAQRIFAASGMEVAITCDGQPPSYQPEVQAHIVKIVQEALTNARRHSGGTRVEVSCVSRRRRLTITVRDDGVGFSIPDTSRVEGHWGLVGMRERAQQIGATLEISGKPGQGGTVELVVPHGARLIASGAVPRAAS
jgi:signal transduction histidine kinase/ligand-binding sensor domain-containing protein